jgi:glycosyltransferase involved in cell wall biosynthesis
MKRVGFLGRFVEEKGIDVLADAIPLVTKELPQTRFILAGDYKSVAGGSQIDRLREKLERLSGNVELPGKLSDEERARFYESLDLFVLPSINSYEAFGIVQIEALKAGVPVIASDRRGIRKPIQLTGDGLLVPAGDASALAKAILKRLTMPDATSREEIAARAWKTFSNERVFDQFAAMYIECSQAASLAK